MRFFLIALLLTYTAASPAWAEDSIDLTGRWCATTYYGSADTLQGTEEAEIMIVMTGDTVEVHTSHGSSWTGTYEHENRLLMAKYTRNQYTGQVVLWLQPGDTRLEGQWVNHTGGQGKYTAFRKQGDSCNAALSS